MLVERNVSFLENLISTPQLKLFSTCCGKWELKQVHAAPEEWRTDLEYSLR